MHSITYDGNKRLRVTPIASELLNICPRPMPSKISSYRTYDAIAIIIPTFKGALERANAAADEANLRAYYAEVMANAVLEGKDPVPPKDGNKITVSGVEYTLHGTASFKVENGQLIITYDGPGSNDAVIPGNSTGTKNGSSSDTDASK